MLRPVYLDGEPGRNLSGAGLLLAAAEAWGE